MTITEAITMADELKPNAISTAAKTRWLSECEGIVQTEALLVPPNHCLVYSTADASEPMLIPAPFDRIYWAYLAAMLDFAHGEYSKYQNSMALFNGFFADLKRYIAANYAPADNPNDAPVTQQVKIGSAATLNLGRIMKDCSVSSVVVSQAGSTKFTKTAVSVCDGRTTCAITATDTSALAAGIATVKVNLTTPNGTEEDFRIRRLIVKA